MRIITRDRNYNEIEHEGKFYCQSYEVIVAMMEGKVYLDKRYWNYSTTTSAHINRFLNIKAGEAAKRVKSGEYVLEDLNK